MHLLFGGDSPESVDADEAAWLIDQMGAGATHHANERALLAYLKQEAASLHPLLAPLYQRLEA